VTDQIADAKYRMTISRLTVDKLGVKLYDRASAVLAELIANSYDADANEVVVRAPMGAWLADKVTDDDVDKGYVIEVEDNGTGMTPDVINRYYLRVGAERRSDLERGDVSKKFGRKVMGRKGVGKLAPFGICEKIEVISSGGDLIQNPDSNGNVIQGYKTAHLIMERRGILSETDEDYFPIPGDQDETLRYKTGTLIRLTMFLRRRVPSIEDLNRQLAQRFGLQSADWKINLVDFTNPTLCQEVGAFDVPKMPETEIRFEINQMPDGQLTYQAVNEDGSVRTDLQAGFYHENRFYGLTGWVAYSKENYRDDLMAGVRIYCRGKIATQTNIFNLQSGFTGEYDVRSYFVGELHADWLDEQEDLIQTDRRDILWSHEIGQAFELWGQSVVKIVGKSARNPIKKKILDVFQKYSKAEERIAQSFPDPKQGPIRENAMDLAKMIGKNMRMEEAEDPEQVETVVQLSISLAPHVTLDKKLREAAEADESPLAVITDILKTARIAELSSFGQIAEERVKVIGKVETLKDDSKTLESVFQDLIQEAPWLIDPQWSPITANQSFATLRDEFVKYYNTKTGSDIQLGDFSDPTKRPDFVLSSQDNVIQLIEIKRPSHQFENVEMDRLETYIEQMQNFLNEPNHRELTKYFNTFHVTLVCDGEKLTGVHKTAFISYQTNGRLTYMSWAAFLAKTRKMHQSFLDEAQRQKLLVLKR
jgi:hypothetical protein